MRWRNVLRANRRPGGSSLVHWWRCVGEIGRALAGGGHEPDVAVVCLQATENDAPTVSRPCWVRVMAAGDGLVSSTVWADGVKSAPTPEEDASTNRRPDRLDIASCCRSC